MPSRLGLFGAAGVWAALFGGVVVAIGDAAGSDVLGVIGAVLLAAGVLCFFGVGVRRSRREGVAFVSALAQSAKDALRLAWFVFKSARG